MLCRNKADTGEQPRVGFSRLDGATAQIPLQARGPDGLPKEASSEAQENEGSDRGRREEGGGVIRQVPATSIPAYPPTHVHIQHLKC